MNALLLALLLSAPCEHPGLDALPEERQAAACALLAQQPRTATPADLPAIYERPGFERARERSSGSLQALLAQLRVWFESLFQTSGAETYSNVTRVIVLALALALGTFAALRLANRQRHRPPAPARAPSTHELHLDDPAAHRARAEELLEAAPREAIREALFSLLASLERRRFVRPDRVKTNRELGAELPKNGAPPELVAAVTPLFSWFDRAFYSLAAVPPGEARRFLDDVRKVTEGAA